MSQTRPSAALAGLLIPTARALASSLHNDERLEDKMADSGVFEWEELLDHLRILKPHADSKQSHRPILPAFPRFC